MSTEDDEERSSCLVGLLVLAAGGILGWVIIGLSAWAVIRWWTT
jgi:hypothetical protein